jgi:RimJ/RimL family protein N-acetyltransferase
LGINLHLNHAGRFREAGRINGDYCDEILMAILEDEYRALKGK